MHNESVLLKATSPSNERPNKDLFTIPSWKYRKYNNTNI